MFQKVKIRINDPQTRAVWESALHAKAEVEGRPAWKRGGPPSQRPHGEENMNQPEIPSAFLSSIHGDGIRIRIRAKYSMEWVTPFNAQTSAITPIHDNPEGDPMWTIDLHWSVTDGPKSATNADLREAVRESLIAALRASTACDMKQEVQLSGTTLRLNQAIREFNSNWPKG